MCTSLSILDALGSTYVGRTMEFAGAFPWQLSYFPKGLKFTSTITNNENGISYQTSLGFISITLTTDASANQSNYQVISPEIFCSLLSRIKLSTV